jgi:hypothetical protein
VTHRHNGWTFIRGIWLVVLTVCVWLSSVGTACLLFSLGQFGEAIKQLFRQRKG